MITLPALLHLLFHFQFLAPERQDRDTSVKSMGSSQLTVKPSP